MSAERSVSSWLIPALVAAAVTLASTTATFVVTNWKNTKEHQRETVRIRLQIIDATAKEKFSSLLEARLMLDHVLLPIDELADREAFKKKISDRFSEFAAESTREQISFENLVRLAPPAGSGSVDSQISKLEGPDRLAASNYLVEEAKKDSQLIVKKLLSSLRPASDPMSYRVNLYVAFTLSRIEGGWPATEAQVAKIRDLRSTSNYSDSTFKKRVEEAIDRAKVA